VQLVDGVVDVQPSANPNTRWVDDAPLRLDHELDLVWRLSDETLHVRRGSV
jgi:hypothetical protein